MTYDAELCDCGEGYFDPSEYRTCYSCFQERRESYLTCIWCGRWHSPRYSTCYRCRITPGRDEAGRNLRMDILLRDEFACQTCGSQHDPQVDHIEPCAKGGAAVPWNLQVLCRECNKTKGADYDWRWELRRFRLMHLYFTFGWRMLDAAEREQLILDAKAHGDEFAWHTRYLGTEAPRPISTREGYKRRLGLLDGLTDDEANDLIERIDKEG